MIRYLEIRKEESSYFALIYYLNTKEHTKNVNTYSGLFMRVLIAMFIRTFANIISHFSNLFCLHKQASN